FNWSMSALHNLNRYAQGSRHPGQERLERNLHRGEEDSRNYRATRLQIDPRRRTKKRCKDSRRKTAEANGDRSHSDDWRRRHSLESGQGDVETKDPDPGGEHGPEGLPHRGGTFRV